MFNLPAIAIDLKIMASGVKETRLFPWLNILVQKIAEKMLFLFLLKGRGGEHSIIPVIL